MNHLEQYQYEVYVPIQEQNWLLWADKAEKLFGHSLDGDLDKDGYCMSCAYDWFLQGCLPMDYVNHVNNIMKPGLNNGKK